jgi:hexosaminidase
MQGQTWSETIRTDDQYYEMAFPRVLAVAERAWHHASWELDWTPGVTYNATTGLVPEDELASDYNGFVTKLGCHEMSKMKKLGIAYRVPPPGGSIASGVLSANSELPCTDIMYSMDEGNTWSEYSGPVTVEESVPVHLQSTSSDGTLKSRIVGVEQVDEVGASELASDLRVTLEMGKNFGHDADCSMADWGLCYTQTLKIEYLGDGDYSNK